MRKNADRKASSKKRGVGWFFPALMIVFASITVFGAGILLTEQKENDLGTDTYDQIAKQAVIEETEEFIWINGDVDSNNTGEDQSLVLVDPESPQEVITALPSATQPPSKPKVNLNVDFEALKAVNPSTSAWIYGCGGDIHYPVVLSEDHEYYLDHLIDGTQNKNGTIFIDFRNRGDFRDRHTLVYGHNMSSGAMFASLSNYQNQKYYNENPTLTLITPEGKYTLEVFSGYVTPGNSDIYQITFADNDEYMAYLQRIAGYSDFDCPVVMTENDRLVTLSTCTYEYDDARYVLHCKLTQTQ